MNKNLIFLLSSLVISAIFLVGCQVNKSEKASSTVSPSPIVNSIVAEGRLLPAQFMELSFFPNGGKIDAVFFKEGELVNKGDILAKLVITPQQLAAVAAAEENLINVENVNKDYLEQVELLKAQSLMTVSLAKERLEDASDKKRDKEYTYRFSKTREATIELDKALTDFELATQELAFAEANAAKLEYGPDADQLAALDAQVKNAEEQLSAARASITFQSELEAPMDGQVILANIIPGQVVEGSQAILTLADTTHWIIETSDLKETDILSVAIGDKATIRIDALQGEDFDAEVSAIQPFGIDQQGDITYKVTLSIEDDPRFLWGLTSSIRISK
jgi:multidrug resistance efflux pump